MLSLPLSLEGVGEALNLDKKKMSEGKDLIRYFCMPCKPTKANGGRTRNLPSDAPEKWELFKTYCIRDVDVEKQIKKRKEKHNPDGTGDCVKKCLWNSKNFDIMGTGTPEPGERQEDKCT